MAVPENVAFAVALGTATELAAAELADGTPGRIAALRDDLHRRPADALPGLVHLNGPDTGRLPNTLNVSIDGALGHELLAAAPGLAASTGSACHSGTHTPSPVLNAMGLDADRALGALRLSLSRWSTRRPRGSWTRRCAEEAACSAPSSTPPPKRPPRS